MILMWIFNAQLYFNLLTQVSNNRFMLSLVSSITTAVVGFNTPTTAQSLPKKPTNSAPKPKVTPISALPKNLASGNQISLNGRTLPAAWLQGTLSNGSVATYLSDGAVRQFIGVDLLNTNNPTQQPIQWFSTITPPLVANAQLTKGNRYLDITSLAKTAGWQIQANGNILSISTAPSTIINIRQGKRPVGERIVIDLDRPTPWRALPGSFITATPDPKATPDPDELAPKSPTPPAREWLITLDSQLDPALVQRYNPPSNTETSKQVSPTPESFIRKVDTVKDQTVIAVAVPFGQSIQVSTLPNPNRLVLDIRPDALVEKNITWAQGVRWQQKWVNLGTEKFPVVWLEVNPKTVGLKLKPIWVNPQNLTGTAPLTQTARNYTAIAAINAGFFNRNNKLPLGAIRRDNQWISGPILNRGAIAWNDSGQFYFGRLSLVETIIVGNNRLPILFLNSGYVQSGIARYTPAWGTTYTPLIDNEIIIVVQNNQITNQITAVKAGENPVPIPQNGYLLTLRGNATSNAAQLPIGTKVSITSTTTPVDFNRYPNIIGAGPLLLQNRQIVLDAKSEQFSNAFINQKAIRSSICVTGAGTLIIAAVHNRAGGTGPTLTEKAQLLQTMGCINALNLDGGSSTSLYLGEQLLDRPSNTAAAVHNAIGIFLEEGRR